jgi:hypothetical protein
VRILVPVLVLYPEHRCEYIIAGCAYGRSIKQRGSAPPRFLPSLADAQPPPTVVWFPRVAAAAVRCTLQCSGSHPTWQWHVHRSMHRATACGRLQSYANNLEFVSLCTGLLALPDGMGALYATLVSSHFGAEYIQNPTSPGRKQLAECHTRNSELTAALIQNREGARSSSSRRATACPAASLQSSELTSAAATLPTSTDT